MAEEKDKMWDREESLRTMIEYSISDVKMKEIPKICQCCQMREEVEMWGTYGIVQLKMSDENG